MEENEKISDIYKRGFNHGYMMKEYYPDEIKKMQIPKNEPSDYTKGFSDGEKQYEKDQIRGQWHDKPQQNSRTKDKGMNR